MSDNTYNGWTNRATWLVMVWFNPVTCADVEAAQSTIWEAADNIPDFMRDFLCTDRINWDELLKYCEENEEDAEA